MKTKNLVMGTFETPSYTFKAVGSSKQDCRNLLYQAWNKHCRQSGADPAYILEFDDDIYFLELKQGVVYRDNEAFIGEM